MLYSAMIVELKYLYIYLSLAIATTLAYVSIYFFHSKDSIKRKIVSYISYAVTIFIFSIVMFLVFTSKGNGYFSFFTVYLHKS